MNLERLETVLRNCDFKAVRTNREELRLYCRKERDTAYILIICHFQNRNLPDMDAIQQLLHSAGSGDAGVLRKELLLLCIDNSAYARHMAQMGLPVWMIDVPGQRLIVYENQPEDFAGLRKPLELFLEGKAVKERSYVRMAPMNTLLVGVNVLIFFVMLLTGAAGDSRSMIEWGAMVTPLMRERQEYYRLFTAMFLHFNVEHLTGNMVILLALGGNLERALGKAGYLIIYLAGGLGAGICSCLYHEIIGEAGVAAGASGAIFAVIGALLCMALINKGKLEDITAGRLGLMTAYILYTGFITPQTDNAAHIGGLLTGMLMTGVWRAFTGKGRKGT